MIGVSPIIGTDRPLLFSGFGGGWRQGLERLAFGEDRRIGGDDGFATREAGGDLDPGAVAEAESRGGDESRGRCR